MTGPPGRPGPSLRLVVDEGSGRTHDVVVSGLAPGTTIADLAAALGLPAEAAVRVDGRAVDAGRVLTAAGVVDGSRLGGGPPPPPPAGTHLEVATGPDAGRVVAVDRTLRVGRAADADVVVADAATSRRHLVVAPGDPPLGRDAGSRNGSRPLPGGDALADGVAAPLAVGAELAVGRVVLRSRPAPPAGPPVPRAHHRPPPPPPAPATPRLTLPEPVAPPPARAPFPWTATLVPLLAAAAMAAVLDPRLAWFALLGPVVGVGTWGEERRRARRTRRTARHDLDAALARLAVDAHAAAAAETARRHDLHPDVGELAWRCRTTSTRLWERRPGSDGALRLLIGHGDLPWSPLDDRTGRTDPAARAAHEVAARNGMLQGAPVVVAPTAEAWVGIVGAPDRVAAVARALVLGAAAGHGPADLAVAVAVAPSEAWAWAAWLPHDVTVADTRPGPPPAGTRHALAIAGHPSLAPAPASGWAAVVLAHATAELPARCTTVLELAPTPGRARLVDRARGQVVDDVLVSGCGLDTARACARALAPLSDPDRVDGGDLPTTVQLTDLAPAGIAAADLAAAWDAAGPAAPPRATVGVTAGGPLVLDLAVDGPHGLVVGTTGAGKSELLRALVAGLATTCPPEACSLLLVDFKGGSAFDACADLPHVVGVVTDLDEHLAARALRCLDAEVRFRERVLRGAGAPDLAVYQRSAAGRHEPLARLVVVVDELATLVAELPGFVSALVDVARRGRSLGVHLVLATQRPQGCVNDDIRANADLRIALRVRDGADSRDVLDDPVAATIPRDRPGRAVLRRDDELVAFQAALLSAPAPAAATLAVRPLGAPPPPAGAATGATSALDELVAHVAAAAAATGRGPARRPWPDPLPELLAVHDLGPDAHPTGPASAVVVGSADDPDAQRHRPLTWDPVAGHLLVLGAPGTGTTSALRATVVALAHRLPPAALHAYVIDHDGGGLADVAGLAHVGAHVGAGDRERTSRLVRRLRDEVARRRHADAAGRPTVVLVVDDLGALLGSLDDVDGWDVREALLAVLAEGPAVRVCVAASARHPDVLPAAVTTAGGTRWWLGVDDVRGRSRPGRSRPPGRGVDLDSGLEVQVAHVTEVTAAVAAAVARHGAPSVGTGPAPVGSMPDAVALDDLLALVDRVPARRADGRWGIPLGVGATHLAVVGLLLGEGDHALVAGPPRSGRTAALDAVEAAARRLLADVPVLRLGGRGRGGHDGAARAALAGLVDAPRAALVLVDDADDEDDADGVLARLCALRVAGLHVVAAGRADALRMAHGHWTRAVRRARTGVLLRPVAELDGDLLGATLPRRGACRTGPGRGYLVVDGDVELVQLGLAATPDAGAGRAA